MSPGTELAKIAVHGVPRSGTSWLSEIFNSSPRVLFKYQPLFSYVLKDFLNPGSSREEIGAFFEKSGRILVALTMQEILEEWIATKLA